MLFLLADGKTLAAFHHNRHAQSQYVGLTGNMEGQQVRLNNTTTAYDLMLVFRAPAAARVADRAGCEKMISILAAQHFNQGIPAGLPDGIRVAHKTGDITRHSHDAGIVYPPGRRPYILVVLTKGIAERERSDRLIADISRLVYQTLVARAR